MSTAPAPALALGPAPTPAPAPAPNQSDLCEIAQKIVNQSHFTFLMSLGAILGFLCFLPNILLIFATLKTKIYPANLRILLAHLSLNLAVYSFSFGIKYVKFLTTSPCDMAVTPFDCRVRDLATTIPWYAIVYSLAGICGERIYCSINYRTYDKKGDSKPWLALIVCVLIWTADLTLSLFQLPQVPQDRLISICDSQFTAVSDTFGLKILLIDGSLEIISVVAIFILYFYDKKKLKTSSINRAQFTLAERFQIGQCVQVHSMVVPSVAMHAVCYIPSAKMANLLNKEENAIGVKPVNAVARGVPMDRHFNIMEDMWVKKTNGKK